MKKIIGGIMCLSVLLVCTGCVSVSETTLTSGYYYAEGTFTTEATPYVYLYFDDNCFTMGQSRIFSFAATGSFVIIGNRLIAKTQTGTYVFEIKDSETLLLVIDENNENFGLSKNTKFVFCNDE